MTATTCSGHVEQRNAVVPTEKTRFARALTGMMNWSMKRANDELFRLNAAELASLDLQRTDIPFLLKLGRSAR